MLNKTTDETDGSDENDESVISTTDAPRKSAINEKQALLSLYFNSDVNFIITTPTSTMRIEDCCKNVRENLCLFFHLSLGKN